MTREEIRTQIGRNIAAARRCAGLSQVQLAARLVVASQEISRLECGNRSTAGVETLLRVAHALEVPLTDLLQGIE